MVVWREADSRAFTRSDAWIEVASVLGGMWKVFLIIRWIPRRWRDAVYGMIARNRHVFTGDPVTCRLPDPELAKRLLE